MKHKILVVLVCLVAFASAFTTAFAAEANVTGTISASSAKPGDTVTFTVSMKETTVSSIGVTISEDSGLSIVSGEWLKSGTIANYNETQKKGAFAPGSATAISGNVFKVTLKVGDNVAGTLNVKATVVAKNGAATLFEETVSKSVSVACKSHTWGNIDSKNASGHTRTCTVCGQKETKAHTFDNGGLKKAPTCTEEGSKLYTCTTQGCGFQKTEPVPAAGHTFESWRELGSDHTRRCSVCLITETKSHRFDAGRITKEATCGQDGEKTFTCEDCGAQRKEYTSRPAHTYDNDCDTVCNVCGLIRTITHSWSGKWSSNGAAHWHECTKCGEKKDSTSHTSSDWIVDRPATELKAGSQHKECTVCKYIILSESIPATGCKHSKTHMINVVEPTCTSEGFTGDTVCDTCDTVLVQGKPIPAKPHTIETLQATEPTCYSQGHKECTYCSVCGQTFDIEYIPAVPHDFVNGVCKYCGKEEYTSSEEPASSVAPISSEPDSSEDPEVSLDVSDDSSEEPSIVESSEDASSEDVVESSTAESETTTSDTSTVTSSVSEETSETSDGLPTSIIVLIIILSIVALAVICAVIFFVIKKQKESK